jgi:hypothetical protein
VRPVAAAGKLYIIYLQIDHSRVNAAQRRAGMISALTSEFNDAFDWAVIRLATYVPAGTTQPRLLFGTVSLITKDRPRPFTGKGVERHPVGKGKWGKVFFRRTALSAHDAVAWYRAAGQDGIKTPVPTDANDVDDRFDGQSLLPSAFQDNPEWPSVAMPLGTDVRSGMRDPGDPAPFRGPGSPRIHRRFGDTRRFGAVIDDKAAIAFLRRRLHLDLSDYTEYLGGLALVVPDPVLRRIQHFLVPAQDGEVGERLVYRLVPRSGQTLDGLRLTVLEHRSNLLSRFETFDVPDNGLITVQSGMPFDQTGYAVADPVHGILAYQQPLSFIRAVRVNVGVAGRKVRVEFPKTESPRSPTDSYEVTEFSHELPINVGEPRRDAVVEVIEAEQRRIRRAAATQYKQTWFDGGERSEAITFLRKQIAGARSSVMVADPYFGARQILQFLHAVPRTQIDFTILSSRLAFESEYAEDVEMSDGNVEGTRLLSPGESPIGARRAALELERLSGFERSLATLGKRGMKSVTARVLGGKTPPLHDRFLVIDDEVLFLGNSLNALGDRASLILSVPDSEPILVKLRAMANQAVPFEYYASQRREVLAPHVEGT